MFNNITFENIEYLYYLLPATLAIVGVWWYFKAKNEHATIYLSGFTADLPQTWKNKLFPVLYILRLLTLIFLIIALARPQSHQSWQENITEGIDIVIAMDISGSMMAMDFKPNRLEAAKEVGIKFISGRPNDRIGLVCFAGESFTQCPITTDHATLINQMSKIREGLTDDGTAIGLGLANAVARLKQSDAKSKVIILLTDGVNNTGEIAPLMAADLAATYGIRVYTIGIGRNGTAPMLVQTIFGTQVQNVEVQIDESTLKKIAQRTGGEYFRATNNKALKEIYDKIDKLEKTKMQVQRFSKKEEEFMLWAIAALITFITEIILRNTIFRNMA